MLAIPSFDYTYDALPNDSLVYNPSLSPKDDLLTCPLLYVTGDPVQLGLIFLLETLLHVAIRWPFRSRKD